MPILFDIDMDFFFHGERLLHEAPSKQEWGEPSFLLNRCLHVPHFLHMEHADAFESWGNGHIDGWECWHFDAHADVGEGGIYNPDLLPLGRRANHIHLGNFLFPALKEGVFSLVRWILPPWMDTAYAESSLEHLPAPLRQKILLTPWQDIAEGHIELPRPHRADISFSPAFTPFSAIRHLADLFPEADGELEALADKIPHAVLVARNSLVNSYAFYKDQAGAKPSHLYHGSPVEGLHDLKGMPLYLSPSPAVAVCFGLPLDNSEGWIHGVDHLGSPMPLAYITVPEDKTALLEKPMTLYWTEATANIKPAGDLHGFEYVSDSSCAVAGHRYFSTVRGALEEYGVQVGILGTEKMHPKLCALAKTKEKDLVEWFEMPLKAILSLPVLEPVLLAYLAGCDNIPHGFFRSFPFHYWLDILDRVLLPLTHPFLLPTEDWHGLTHARETARHAGMLAWLEGHSPLAPMLAACLHDAARLDDSEGERHAHDGALLAEIFFASEHGKKIFLTKEKRQKVIQAIREHADPAKSLITTGACLQDADRLRLTWAFGLKEECFSTGYGLDMAKKGPQYAENLLHFLNALGNEKSSPLECKIELTDACNLACSFCHQGFGRKKSRKTMPLDAYAGWLDRFEEEHISMVRLTGGEPLMVPELPSYLGMARDRGFYVTLNSNATMLDMKRMAGIAPLVDCLKISFPAPDAEGMKKSTGLPDAWERKLEAAAFAASLGVQVEFLTPMFPDAIRDMEAFAELLEQLSFVRWLPLRAEAAPGCREPVSRANMLELFEKLEKLREKEHWENLQLGLSAPFCMLDDPRLAATLLHGRQSCGPFSNLAIDPDGKFMRCYSRRSPLDISTGIRSASIKASLDDFLHLPDLCQRCPACVRCLGGCRCPQSLTSKGFDYLARPEQAEAWIKSPLSFLLS